MPFALPLLALAGGVAERIVEDVVVKHVHTVLESLGAVGESISSWARDEFIPQGYGGDM
jgi:hypothetical protein